ncbi:MAG TPA: transglycosylase [Ruminococcaceae bacterium]|nr:transglycosylase [Oscillospiraceae bacterium]HCA29266.1 transglycosylase [Oscillospiraceae bacterium]
MSTNRSLNTGRAAGQKTARFALKALKSILKCFVTIFLIGTITASIVGCVMVAYVVTSFKSSESIPDLTNINLNESSIIYVKNNKGDFVEEQRVQGANSIWKSFEKIPAHMQHAVIAIEDERFETHYGVDWKRTVSAFANLLFHFSDNEYGGSTITQQLIKNLTKDNETSITRKVREIFRAIKMERAYASKDQILEAYLNILPLGRVSGVGAAANYYFAKEVEDLNAAECALIAGITQNPSKYNPYLHPDNAKQRQRTVLYQMYKLGYINDEEYKQAYNQEIILKSSMQIVDVQDYYNDRITEDVINGLMQTYGYSKEYATNMYYYGGLKIYSAKDPAQQSKVEEIFKNEKNFPKHIKGDKEDPQAGIAIIDYNGRLVATVGGRGEKTANRIFNRSIDSTRQPGSAMKPIAVYAPAIKYGLITYSTKFADKKITLKDGGKWPQNYGNYKYPSMPVEEALQRSLNTVPAQIMEMLTPQRSFDFVTQDLHISTLVKSVRMKDGIHTDIEFSPLTLGGLTYGVKCIEMAAAFQVFGNGGYYNQPYTFYSVERTSDYGNEVLLQNEPKNDQALDEDTAYVMNRLLQRVVSGPHGTATTQKIKNLETFGKTGTTNDDKDYYFVGGTPYYVGACWFGYDNNQEMVSSQRSYAKSLWKKSMDALHSGLPKKTFDKKGNTVEKYYDYTTGKLATEGCPKKTLGVYKPEFLPGVCTAHGGGGDTADSE